MKASRPLFRSLAGEAPLYPGHVRVSGIPRFILAAGSGLASLLNPERHDMIAVLSETSSGYLLHRFRDEMKSHAEGRRILRDRPIIRTDTLNLNKMKGMKEGTLGREYANWLEVNGVSPDTRDPVRYIDDEELAYVLLRYRECHDMYHLISGPFPTSFSSEIVVKYFEFANLGLPMSLLAGVFGPLRLKSAKRRERLFKTYVPWAIRAGGNARSLMGVYWEERWEQDLGELRKELGIEAMSMRWDEWVARGKRKTKVEVDPSHAA
ncbi:coenzyme Q4-like protein, isoform CRA_d [Atractiella rhizophila]|nr:coenzyme Q4-like protein, isoform CRA_d [Atractiella rhizophila]